MQRYYWTLAIPIAISCSVANAIEQSLVRTGSFASDAKLQFLPAGNASQTRSPDNGALSIIFEGAKVEDQSNEPSVGVALVTAIVGIAPGTSKSITIDLRGNAALQGDGRCRAVLTTPFGTITVFPKKSGDIFARWKVPVQKSSRQFSFTAVLQCHKGSGAVSASIDSVDLAWGALPEN